MAATPTSDDLVTSTNFLTGQKPTGASSVPAGTANGNLTTGSNLLAQTAAGQKPASTSTTPPDAMNYGASMGANQDDFFGGGTLDTPNVKAPETDPNQDALSRMMSNTTATTNATNATSNANARGSQMSSTPGTTPAQAQQAAASGNIGGATGEYNSVSPSGQATLDYYHDLNSGTGFGSTMNRLGEAVGISHVGDLTGNPLTALGNVRLETPMTAAKGLLNAGMDPNTGLGTTLVNSPGGSSAGRPLTNMTPGTAAAAQAFQNAPAPSIGDFIKGAVSGLGGSGASGTSFNTSGGDRGSSKIPGIDDAQQLLGANAQGAAATQRGQDVLTGQLAPGGQGAGLQSDALQRSLAFLNGPRAQNDVMGKLDQFIAQPSAPSDAQATLQQGAQGAMSDALSLARSGRARDAGSQARALSQAMAENAQTGVDNSRNAALLKAQEGQTAKQNQLSALGQEGTLSGGLDSNTLQALGLGANVATDMRNANTTERGQSLGYDTSMQQTNAALTGDVLKTIPQIESVNQGDWSKLTPQQQLAQAQMGHPLPTTEDQILGAIKDIAPLL